MSKIRKGAVRATIWIYIGFGIGALNVFFFTHQNWFSPAQYGLSTSLRELSVLFCGISTLGTTSFLIKFFPYYQDNLKRSENDILGLALKVALVGFTLMATLLFLLKPLIIQKFAGNSPILVEYFYYTIPLTFSMLIFNLLEAYGYAYGVAAFATFLKETLVRFYTLLIILLKVFNAIDFTTFILLFSLQYLVIAIVIAFRLYTQGNLNIHFSKSRVTQKYRKHIISIMSLTMLVVVVSVLRSSIDTLVLASKINIESAGFFAFATYLASLIQAPYRSLVAITTPLLSRAWKDKNHKEIKRVYKRTSINLLMFSLFAFFLIWLNFDEAIAFFGIGKDYLAGKWVFFIIGLVAIVETGTGVNGQIIGTSTYWRFELMTSILLTCLIIPLSYYMTIHFGIIGPAIANLVSFSVYNAVRIYFLWNKFRLQPFSKKSLEILGFSVVLYLISYFIFKNLNGLPYLLSVSIFFTTLFFLFVFYRNISPDIKPIMANIKRKIFSGKSNKFED